MVHYLQIKKNDMLDQGGGISRPNTDKKKPLTVINSLCTSTTANNANDILSNENFSQVLEKRLRYNPVIGGLLQYCHNTNSHNSVISLN